jgi:hypothetical protein
MNGRLVALAVGLLAIAAVGTQAWRHEAQAQQRPPQWEYKVVYCGTGPGRKSYDDQLNELAAMGWEYAGLVAVPIGGKVEGEGGQVAFKRPKR